MLIGAARLANGNHCCHVTTMMMSKMTMMTAKAMMAMITMMGGAVAAADSDDCQEQLKSNSSPGNLDFSPPQNAAAHGQWTIHPSIHPSD